MFFKILKLGADGFLTRFFDFQFWSVAPPGCAIFFFLSLNFIIDQPLTEVWFTIFWLKQPPRLQGGSYLQAEISMFWRFFLNQPTQGCLRPKIYNYWPIGISWSGTLGWAIKLIIHRILLYGDIKKAKNHYS